MSIPVPNLDDREFTDLVNDAIARIRQLDPEWTDLSVHDPGVVLVEAMAWLTDTLLYRLNRVPERLYATFLNLLGTSLGPPGAATATLEFRRAQPGPAVEIPEGTQVSCPPGMPGQAAPVFTTLARATIAEGQTSATVLAADVVLHREELGAGNGGPGQAFTLAHPPVVAGVPVTVRVQVPEGSVASGGAVVVDGASYRICREVTVFGDARPGELVYRLDRTAGVLSFAWYDPAEAEAEPPAVPGAGMKVQVDYASGGGEQGNVAAGTLTVLRKPIPDVTVTNPEPATGGHNAEDLASALRRAPRDFQARDRAVTARDYEVIAIRHGGVERAHAVTRREAWAFAAPGEVEVALVPHVPQNQRPGGRVTLEALAANAREEVRAEVAAMLAERATIGARPVVGWGSYKQVAVDARVVVRPEENADAVRERILARLAATITPVPEGGDAAPGFGRPLRVSNLYRWLEQAEPGVQYVERVRLELAEVPDADATDLVRAEGQAGTWFVAQAATLFRTTNHGEGWEACGHFDTEPVRAVATWPQATAGRGSTLDLPGHVVVATDHGAGCRIRVSTDLGTTWTTVADLGFGINDLVWIDRAGTPTILAAGTQGVYEIPLTPGAVPVPNVVDPQQPDRGFHAIAVFTDVRGRIGVAVAAEAAGGIWLSSTGGAPESFRLVRAPGEEIRSLSVQYDGPRVFLWAPRAAPEGDGTGCLRLPIDELGSVDIPTLAGQWQELAKGWTGGSCWMVRVIGDTAFAASQSSGVLSLRLGTAEPVWEAPDVNCGLPLRDRRRFVPLSGVSGVVLDDGRKVVLAAGAGGVHRWLDGGQTWRSCSARVVDDVVTVPPSWLFCSGEHRVEVVRGHG